LYKIIDVISFPSLSQAELVEAPFQ